MHVLYVDDSGSASNPNERFFVLAEFDFVRIAETNGRKEFCPIKRPEREKMIHAALGAINRTTLRLFAVAVDKQVVSPRDSVEVAFEEISNRFNLYLQRLNNGNPPEHSQRGLIVMDETAHEGRLQSLARHFRVNGGRWGHFRNLAEVPLFVDSRASRCIQLADLIAWATWRKYEIARAIRAIVDEIAS
jgi:Protein of unknown function (DUF3800)